MCNPGVVPIVLTHARALLTGTPAGRTAYLDADVRDVKRILTAPEIVDTLDLSRPVALSLLAVGHFLPDSDDPGGIVRRLVDALPAGSYLVLSHLAPDHDPSIEAGAKAYRARGIPLRPRTRAEVEALFDGLELLDPGLVSVHRWRPDAAVPADLTDAQVSAYGAIGRKPSPSSPSHRGPLSALANDSIDLDAVADEAPGLSLPIWRVLRLIYPSG
ncbi:SAM-dependent methyltransferase [Frankia sp. QA3]|uniref:SAM-dependent methyltransferase n=1 Tax=Frankia sp. QA3 TaxID=710111 RepID=UPI000269C483|nr:Protein of unknown function (DUF574) [Frankia sp. QA3]